MTAGRPRKAEGKKRTAPIHALLTPEEKVAFERLVEAVSSETGITMTSAMTLRWLVMKELRARGLDKPAAPAEEPPRAEPKRPKAKKTRG